MLSDIQPAIHLFLHCPLITLGEAGITAATQARSETQGCGEERQDKTKEGLGRWGAKEDGRGQVKGPQRGVVEENRK